MQAIILAAGKGKRLGKLGDIPKCLLEVNGEKLIDRTLASLEDADIKNVIIVVNYKADMIEEYLTSHYSDFNFTFINENITMSKYVEDARQGHNNIYSLYLCSEYLKKDDTVLIESDILYPKRLIWKLTDKYNSAKSFVVVSKFDEKTMFGSALEFNPENQVITKFDRCIEFDSTDNLYKTVNIYKFTKEWSQDNLIPALEEKLKNNGIFEFYEQAIFDTTKYTSPLYAFILHKKDIWWEIDTASDYDLASYIMTENAKERYIQLKNKYGGYWRIPNLVDCCYLGNPFFNPKELLYDLQDNLKSIITSYPSGEYENRRNAGRLFNLNYSHILVGNGAGELIRAVGKTLSGTATCQTPIFNEYIEAFGDRIHLDWDADNDIHIIVNPNNPTNNLVSKEVILKCINNEFNCVNTPYVIIDESFMDFVEPTKRFSFLDEDFLINHPNVIIIKSLGKSYNLNGAKLGILAGGDINLINKIRDNLPSWNINGVSEFLLRELYKYQIDYSKACLDLIKERKRIIKLLTNELNNEIYVEDSNTDFITIYLRNVSSQEFCVDMLYYYNIFIKDLSDKKGMEKLNAVRISINLPEVNDYVIESIKDYFLSK